MFNSNNEIRMAILEELYYEEMRNPLGLGLANTALYSSIQAEKNQVDACVIYLQQKRLLTLEQFGGADGPGYLAKITAYGTDAFENKDKYKQELPFLQVAVQNFNGPSYGNATIVQGNRNQVTINQQITDAFKSAHDILNQKNDLSEAEKTSINTELNELEQEVRKEKNADPIKLGTKLGWLKEHSIEIASVVVTVVTEVIKLACMHSL